MISKVGISLLIFNLLYQISRLYPDLSEDDWSSEVQNLFTIDSSMNRDFPTTIDLIFETILSFVTSNRVNQIQASKHIEILQKFLFLEGKISKVLITIFDQHNISYEVQNLEIHKETLYKKIYEHKNLKMLARRFIKMLRQNGDSKYLYLLRKLCVVKGNSLPLIQLQVYKKMFEKEMNDIVYGISWQGNSLIILKYTHNENYEAIPAHSFDGLASDEASYIINQLALESNLCHGRPTYLHYFKNRYPADKLVYNIIDEGVSKRLRSMLIRILSKVYIDSAPNKMMKMSRCFKAFTSIRDPITSTGTITNELTSDLLEKLLVYYNNYFYAFAQTATSSSYVKDFEFELIKC